MLTTPTRPETTASETPSGHGPSGPVMPRVPVVRPLRVEVRQRRTVTVLVALLVAVVVAAVASGAGAVWLVALAVALVAGGYLALVARVRSLNAQREMSVAFDAGVSVDWDAFERNLAGAAVVEEANGGTMVPAATVRFSNRDLLRFVASYSLGLALTPVVAAIRLAGGDLSDLERHGVIDRIVRLQTEGRAQSFRFLAAGVVATAGVASIGGLAASGTAMAASAPSAAVPTGVSYVVHAGDTLGSIAARFGVSISALASANHISDTNLIFPGRELVIPTAVTTSADSASSAGSQFTGTYTVTSGNTLSQIAGEYGTTYSALASANHLANPNFIYPGEELHVPAGGPAVTTSATTSYTVQTGDTLSRIAARFGTTVSNLVGLNHLANANFIYVGEVLRVAGTAATTSAPGGGSGSGGGGAAPGSGGGGGKSAPAPSGGESAQAAEAVRVALSEVGVPYVWGGASPSGFDCSGLVMYAYAQAGVSLDHYTVSQWEETSRVSESQLLPGDLVFYYTSSGAQPGHVAMYIGHGQVVSANETGTNVQTQSLSWDGSIMGFGRVNS